MVQITAFFSAFRRYADFKGRTSREEFWYFILGHFITTMGLFFLSGGSTWLVYLYWVVSLVPLLAAWVRRIHDAGSSGWFILVPFLNLELAIVEDTDVHF